MDLSKKVAENMDIYSGDSTECESDWLDSTEEEVDKVNETWKRKRVKHTCWVKSWMLRKQEIGKYNQQLAILASSDPDNYQKIMKLSIAAFNNLDLDLPTTAATLTQSMTLRDGSRIKNHCASIINDVSRTMNNANQLTSSLPNISQSTGQANPLGQIQTNVYGSVSHKQINGECDSIMSNSNELPYVKSLNGLRHPKFSSATKSFLKMIGVKLDAMPLKQQLELKMRLLQMINIEYTNI